MNETGTLPEQSASGHKVDHKPIQLLGMQLTPYSCTELLQLIDEAIAEQRQCTILSGNIHAYNLAYETPWLREYFNQADAVRLDGAGVRLGARIIGHQTPPRMTWADFAWDLADMACKKQRTLYFLGGRPGIAEKAAQQLREELPHLQIIGTAHGYFEKGVGNRENEQVKARINDLSPDILVIGFGMPVQEHWLMQNRDDLSVPVVLTGGAVFDYIAGETARAPTWLTKNGFEWLGRLFIEPRRLWHRYLVGNPKFFWRLLKQQAGPNHSDIFPQT